MSSPSINLPLSPGLGAQSSQAKILIVAEPLHPCLPIVVQREAIHKRLHVLKAIYGFFPLGYLTQQQSRLKQTVIITDPSAWCCMRRKTSSCSHVGISSSVGLDALSRHIDHVQ